MFLTQGNTYDVSVMVIFLFQMVFMDTALTIVTGTAAERWKYAAFLVSSFFLGAFIYPIFANWAWGGGWLATLGTNFGLGKGYADFAGSGVVHVGRRPDRTGHGHPYRTPHRKVQPRRPSSRHARSRPGDRPHRLLSSSPSAGSVFNPGLHAGRFRQTATCASARWR